MKELFALGHEGWVGVWIQNPTALDPATGMSDFASSDVPVMRSSRLVVAIH
jgi:hypothetical protein